MLVIVLLAILPFSLGDRCQHPPPAANYQNSLYQGRWYEIGKVINQSPKFSTQFSAKATFSAFLKPTTNSTLCNPIIHHNTPTRKNESMGGYIIKAYEKIVAEPRYIQFFANFSWKTARLPKEVCLPENEIRYLSFFSLAKK